MLIFDASKLVSSDSPWFITHHGSLTSHDPPAAIWNSRARVGYRSCIISITVYRMLHSTKNLAKPIGYKEVRLTFQQLRLPRGVWLIFCRTSRCRWERSFVRIDSLGDEAMFLTNKFSSKSAISMSSFPESMGSRGASI